MSGMGEQANAQARLGATALKPATDADRQRLLEYAERKAAEEPGFSADWIAIANVLGIALVEA